MMMLSALLAMTVASPPSIDDRAAIRAGFKLAPDAQTRSAADSAEKRYRYTRKADGARLMIRNYVAPSEEKAVQAYELMLRWSAGMKRDEFPLPSGKPIGRKWQYHAGVPGSSGVGIFCVSGRSVLGVSLLYLQVRKDGRNLWRWHTGNLPKDRMLVETVTRDILRSNEKQL